MCFLAAVRVRLTPGTIDANVDYVKIFTEQDTCNGNSSRS